jgi:malic enzyme
MPTPSDHRRGADLLNSPPFNRDTAFTAEERQRLGLRGLLLSRVTSIEEQMEVELEHLRRKTDDLEKYIGLVALLDRNEPLFHRLLLEHIEDLAPIIYTPTVADACRQFSHVMRRPRGLWITPDDIGCMPDILRECGRDDVRLIVATDNERILGLGDQGAGGMAIPVGKLALYSAGAGIHPARTLPVSLDCGTDNDALLADPHYLGYPEPRLRGADYDAFVDAFVAAMAEVFPAALLQWEDFKQYNALRLLERYRHRLPSFNDDIQGTAAVVVGGMLAALRLRGERMSAQRIVFVGAGAAGIGIARLVEAVMAGEGADATVRRRAVVMLDSKGLIYEGRAGLDEAKLPFALSADDMASLSLDDDLSADLQGVVRRIGPTVLVGTSGVPGAFTEGVVRAMAARTGVPIVFPLSNPTESSEATPADVLLWSGGRALVATGSPFEPVSVGGTSRVIGQANNVFIFPGVGLGAVVSGAREITDEMFLVAAETLADCVSNERLDQGALYPRLSELRTVSGAIGLAVARRALGAGLARLPDGRSLEQAFDAMVWTPGYEQPSG